MDEPALIYDAAAQRGISPRECDESEIWVLAAALGANRADEDAEPVARGMSFNDRRTTALAKGEAPPRWEDEPMTARERADAQRMMAGFGGVAPILPPDFQGPADLG